MRPCNSVTCSLTLTLLEQQTIDLRVQHEDLESHHGEDTKSRPKRGLINGVSYGLNFLFGVPDSDDSAFFHHSIDD